MLDIEAPVAPRQQLVLANGLQWLAPEIDASLHRVRLLIDQQQEAEEGELDTEAVLAELKLVLGALRMADCHGAVILSEELCAAVAAVAGGKLLQPNAALAAVSGATLQLSDYLDALRQGAADRAAVLQPAIGELRLACEQVAATEADLFVRQMLLIGALPPLPPGSGEPGAAAAVVAGKLLPAFQSLLLQWLKGLDVANSLLKLRKVGDHIASHASRPEIVLLWSAFAAAIDSLVTAPGTESLELKRWVGRLSQQIKVLGEQGEVAAAVQAPEIAWRLLAHAAAIHHGGSRWLMLRHYLPLDSTLPIEPALSEARLHLRGPNTRLLEKVADEVRADLSLVKDGLDLALRSGGLTPDAQTGIRDRIGRIANTLLLLGLPQLEQVLRNQAGELGGLDSSTAENQSQWMRIATALLRVEHSLETALYRPLRQKQAEPSSDPAVELIETVPHSQDLREGVNALLREMLVDLAKLKAQLDAYLKGAELRVANEPLQLLGEVSAGLIILDHLPAATLVGQLRDWLREATPAELRHDPVLAVCFAEAVAALEIYLEALRDVLPQPGRVLETLHTALQPFITGPVVELSLPQPASAGEALQLAAASELLVADTLHPLREMAAIELPASADDDPGHFVVPAAVVVEPAMLIEAADAAEPMYAAAEMPLPEASATVESPVSAPAAGNDDPEIRLIFIEEVQEVLDTLKRQLPVFHRDPSEPGTLGEIRRAFHTLKGSGRMVGADRIGDYGWAIEHLLNRCIEGALPVNRAVVSLIDDAVQQLPGLLAAFSENRLADEATRALVARAHFLASGRAPEMVEKDVLEVFRVDALDRLADLERWLADAAHREIDPDAVRALHTIKGSAAVVNAEPLSQLAGALESVLKHLTAAEAAMPPEVSAVFGEVLPVLKDWTRRSGQATPPESADWLARVEALKPFLPPSGETRSLVRRDSLVNLAYERLQLVEQRLVSWTLNPSDAELCAAMGHAAEGLATVSAECLPLSRGAEALTERLRRPDLQGETPDSAFFTALTNTLENFYQFLDAYREGGIRDSGRELAELLRQLPLTSPSAQAESEPPVWPLPDHDPIAFELQQPGPVWAAPEMVLAGETPSPELELEVLDALHAIPHQMPLPPENVDDELAALFVEEARELIDLLKLETLAWQPPQATPLAVIHALHTLTGSARITGYRALGDLAHGFERRLQGLETGAASAGVIRAELLATLPVLEQAIDAFAMMVSPEALAVLHPAEASASAGLMPQYDEFMQGLTGEQRFSETLLDDGVDDDAAHPPQEPSTSALPVDQPSLPPIEQAGGLLQAQPSLIESMDQDWQDVAGNTLGHTVPHQEQMLPPAPAVWAAGSAVDDIDPELAQIFIAEAGEMLEAMTTALADWRRDAGDPAAISELQRALHTMKGGARMTGFMPMGDASHEMESRVAEILLRGQAPTTDDHIALQADLESLERMHDALSRGQYPNAAFSGSPQPLPGPVDGGEERDEELPKNAPARVPEPMLEGWEPELFWQPEQDSTITSRRELARVPVESLDSMLNEAGEISIYRSRLEQQNTLLINQLTEMRQTVVRLREQLRLMDIETDAQIAARGLNAQGGSATPDRYEQDFDPLEMDRYSRMQELSRALAEAVGDLSSLHLTMDQGVAEAQALLLQQGRINTAVQQGLMGTLMVPFSRQVARLQRVVRQTAQEEGKLADVVFEGVESELDRNVLERMTAPLEHLLRNAVVHGLEDPQGRSNAGKPAMGMVSVRLKREGTQLLMEIADDGRGLNFDAIRTKATEKGLLPMGANLGEDEIARFIFEPNFSTAEALTQSAGRGVGMDVVASEVKQLGGSLELRSDAGQGTRFTVRLPLSLALSQALMVKVGEEVYALPLVAIEGIGRVPRASAATAAGGGEAEFNYAGHDYRVRYLAELIDLPHGVPEDVRTVPAVLVRMGEGVAGGDRRAALVVDQLLGNREVVSKAVGPQLSSISGVAGATILPSGEVVLILDPSALVIDRARRRLIAEAAASRAAMERQSVQGGRLIMVVDDSVTMRRVAERLLQRNGYRVITAKDGLDAIAMLQNETPAAILLDIEMPRADGFEVAGFVRHNERIQDTPIIMITSRSGDKHRTRAATLGVNRYLIKPYQEDQLLHELRSLLQAREAEAA